MLLRKSATVFQRLAFGLAILSALVTAPAMLAQTNAGTITGTVYDQSKAVIDHVQVTATHLATNVVQSATTNKDGVYSLPALEPGTYRLVLEKTGFKKLSAGAYHG